MNKKGKAFLIIASVAFFYFITSILTIELLAILPSTAASVWPAAGIALYTALNYGRLGEAGVLLGAFAFYFTLSLMDSSYTPIVNLPIDVLFQAIANMLQAMAGSYLIKRLVGYPNQLTYETSIIRFLVLAGPVSCLVSSTLHISALYLVNNMPMSEYFTDWFTWWVGDCVGVLIFTPLLLTFFHRSEPIWRSRKITLALPLVFILATSFIFQYENNNNELTKQGLKFKQTAIDVSSIIEDDFNFRLNFLYSIKSLYDSSKYVSRKEFNIMAHSILQRHPSVLAIEWIEKIDRNERADFEMAARNEGFESFYIKNQHNDVLSLAEEADEYYVISYVEPIEKNSKALGYNILSKPEAKKAAKKSVDTGMPISTAPIRLIQEIGNQKGFVIYLPVYKNSILPESLISKRKNIKGFIAAVFRIDEVMMRALSIFERSDMYLKIYDVTNNNQKTIFESSTPPAKKTFEELEWQGVIKFAERVWQLDFYPTDQYIVKNLSGDNKALLFANFSIVLFLVGWLLSITGRSFRTEQIVSQRTKELRREIEERSRVEKQLSYHASHDMLTELANRREFENKLQQAIQTKNPNDTNHILCLMDLDRFKIVNDTCGHIAGDELLRQVSKLLKERVRRSDTLARIGGDEFGLLIENCPEEEALSICDDILKIIQDYKFIWEEKSFSIGISIGMVIIDNAIKDSSIALQEADDACYLAKEEGRNRVRLYVDDDKVAQRKGEIKWVSKINNALDSDGFTLMAQEIRPVKQGQKKYEILVRMLGDDGEIISPAMFLPAAERYNLIEKIDFWVITHVFQSFSKARDRKDFPMLSINLSSVNISRPEFLTFITDNLQRFNVPCEKICFEITETAAISNLVEAEKFIRSIKDFGCAFALDDFGSGFSSFAYLKNLPVDYLKIDGIFVKDIVVDDIDRAMVRSINDIGHVMGKKTIAEFVESDDILNRLEEIGVDFVQGFGIAKPVPFIELIDE